MATTLLAGCAGFSPDGGFGAVAQTTREQLGKDLLWARSAADQPLVDQRVAELLAQPLTADDAVQLALLNNRGLQADLQELGITEAELVQASRWPNPGFSLARLRRGDETELERGLHINLARWLLQPLVGRMQAQRLQQTQGLVAMQVLALAANTRKAYVVALAADESLHYLRQVQQAALAGAELARRMAQVGNFNKLQRAREQGFAADAALNLARAEQLQRASRERLVRLLGLWGTQTQLALPERLPDLPAQALNLPDVERNAIARRLDVQAARLAAEQSAANLALVQRSRFIQVLDLGLVRNSATAAPTQRGWEIGVELPFDWGDARIAKAQALAVQARHRAVETAINARSEVREAYTAYRSAYDIARYHLEEIVPLRKQIADENLLRYNGMLIGVFELLADARVQIGSVNAAIEARRDFWIAQADLDMALIGKPSLAAAMSGTAGASTAADAAGH